MSELKPIPVYEIIAALEREAETATSPQWLAAQHLRRMKDWTDRTLMCGIDQRPSETLGPGGAAGAGVIDLPGSSSETVSLAQGE